MWQQRRAAGDLYFIGGSSWQEAGVRFGCQTGTSHFEQAPSVNAKPTATSNSRSTRCSASRAIVDAAPKALARPPKRIAADCVLLAAGDITGILRADFHYLTANVTTNPPA